MKTSRHLGKVIFAWLLLGVACHALGATLSELAVLFGFTDFPNDRRGEWSLVVIPMLVVLAITVGAWPVRFLARHYSGWLVAALMVVIVAASCGWLTWRFATAS